jgi:hypothetical protein
LTVQQQNTHESSGQKGQRFLTKRYLILIVFSMLVLVASVFLAANHSWLALALLLIGSGSILSSLVLITRLLPIQLPPLPTTPTSLPESKEPITVTHDLNSPLFFVNTHLPAPQEFFGRARERMQLLTCIVKETSASIVGPRRIGKTWLLEYLRQVAPTELNKQITIGYINAALPSCNTVTGFTEEALKVLGSSISLSHSSSDLASLERYVYAKQRERQKLVLCIDNFDTLTSPHKEFDRSFFEALRAIAQQGLCLVVVSQRPLIDLLSESMHTSPFFNIFSQIRLLPFNETEALGFLNDKGQQAGFTLKEREELLKYSQDHAKQWPPLRLQLACELFLENKRAHKIDLSPEDSAYGQNLSKQLDNYLYR